RRCLSRGQAQARRDDLPPHQARRRQRSLRRAEERRDRKVGDRVRLTLQLASRLGGFVYSAAISRITYSPARGSGAGASVAPCGFPISAVRNRSPHVSMSFRSSALHSSLWRCFLSASGMVSARRIALPTASWSYGFTSSAARNSAAA